MLFGVSPPHIQSMKRSCRMTVPSDSCVARAPSSRSLDFLQRHIAHLCELQKTHHRQQFPSDGIDCPIPAVGMLELEPHVHLLRVQAIS